MEIQVGRDNRKQNTANFNTVKTIIIGQTVENN